MTDRGLKAVFYFTPTLSPSHPEYSIAEVAEQTGFDDDCPEIVHVTPPPTDDPLRLLRHVAAPQLAEFIPQFAAAVFGATAP